MWYWTLKLTTKGRVLLPVFWHLQFCSHSHSTLEWDLGLKGLEGPYIIQWRSSSLLLSRCPSGLVRRRVERQSLGREVTVGGSPAWCVCVCVCSCVCIFRKLMCIHKHAFINIQHEVMCVSMWCVHHTVVWQTFWGFHKLFFQQKCGIWVYCTSSG